MRSGTSSACSGRSSPGQAADGFAQAVIIEVLLLDPFSQGTPGRVLSIAALTLLPYSLVAPFLGVFVDRWPRRTVLAWTNFARAALLLSFPLWSWATPGQFELYAAMFLLLGAGRLFLTAKGATLPVVLHEHHLLRGNSISSGGGMVSALMGGVLGVVGAGDDRNRTGSGRVGLHLSVLGTNCDAHLRSRSIT